MRITVLILLVLVFSSAKAQYNTGDTQLNASLVQIDANASVNFSLFKTDMSSTYHVSEAKISNWSVSLGMKAGDIYFALELSRITKKPIDDVIKFYTSNRKRGWGVIAKDLGIKPGSPEFHALKGGAGKRAANGNGKGNAPGKNSGGGGQGNKGKGKKN